MTATTDLSGLHEELATVARDVLGTAHPDATVDWGLIIRSGWVGLDVPSEFDGADATFAEVAVVLGEFGRAAARGPYPSVALAMAALAGVDRHPARDELLTMVTGGDTVVVVALPAETNTVAFDLEITAGGATVSGTAAFVLDAPYADRLLIPARDASGDVVLVDVDARSNGLELRPRPVVDATRSFADITADGVSVDAEHMWRCQTSGDFVSRLRDRAAASIACDSLGIAEAMLDATVDYARVREQFGRPIGSFQAVKHACADMYVQVAIARRLVGAAVTAVAAGDPDAGIAVSQAKSYACDAAVAVAGKAIQLHGGIGYTWESGLHVYLKRATLNRALYGSPAHHRQLLADRY
ncbi:acyl-CoA dehydrogenase family protein [Gordonia sp. CPCC 205515]|uniref:acyl-CoA dehydrogenase family protein n=1 Tax=Gordonia sp. CPCC 205515 TaxID=3140791 RepID=UPI003AF356F7